MMSLLVLVLLNWRVYSGKMAVLWDKYERRNEDKMIWCVVIARSE